MHQDYQDFKVVVSDDCSPEDLKDVYDSVVRSDSRFTYRRNKENIGGKSLVDHWNLLVELCDTDFFIMSSDDDVYASNYLSEIDKLIAKYPQCNFFRGRAKYIDENGNLMVNDVVWPEYTDNMHFILMAMSGITISCEANNCYRTKAFKEKGGYQKFPVAWFTDDATHVKMASMGCACTSDIVFGFRSSSLNISAQRNNPKISADKVLATLDFWAWIIAYLKKIKYESESSLMSWTINECRKAVLSQYDQYIIHCKLKDFCKFSQRASRTLGLSRLVYLFYWGRYRIKGV